MRSLFLILAASGCAADPIVGPWDCVRLGDEEWPLVAEERIERDGVQVLYQSFRSMRLHMNRDLTGFTITDELYLTFHDDEQTGEELSGRTEVINAKSGPRGQYTFNPSGPDEEMECALEGDRLDCERGQEGDSLIYAFERGTTTQWPW